MCQLHQMMHRQEETQRRSRPARGMAARNHHSQSLSRRSHSHSCRAREAAASTSAHKSSLRERQWKPVSENILFSPLMFTVLPSCCCCCCCHPEPLTAPDFWLFFLLHSSFSFGWVAGHDSYTSELTFKTISWQERQMWCQISQVWRRNSG